MEQKRLATSLTPAPEPAGEQDFSISSNYLQAPTPRVESHWQSATFPEVGDLVDQCRLVAELGSGASGQAFLAMQEALAYRPIVLKLTSEATREEHLTQARLQHTHIMPLYWASALPEKGLRVLAMPYLACTTLAGLLERLEEAPRESWTGQRVFDFLQDDEASMPMPIAINESHARILKQSTWVEFVVRMGQTLAEALAYVHQRDLLHLDLKPSNVLITPEGNPILLDLDVARPPLPAGARAVSWLGGTTFFMSPEQQSAMEALTNRQPIPYSVDGRSDLYSLGLVLYQALGGQYDDQHRPDPKGLPRPNSKISEGLADIIAHCLAENPADRYATGDDLAEDLRRHLADLPLRGVRNRLLERGRKWCRRRPLGVPVVLLLVGLFAIMSVAIFNSFHANEDRLRQAEAALADGQELQRKGQHEAAVHRFLAGKELAAAAHGSGHLRANIERRLHLAERLQKADELSHAVHLLRFYALQEHTPRRMQYVLEAAGRKLWTERELLTDSSAGLLESAAENRIRAELQELVLLWSDLQIHLAPQTHADLVRAEVRKVLTQAEQMFGSSLAWTQTGPNVLARQPQATWEFCALSRIALAKGKYPDAADLAQRALDQDPLEFAPNFYVGVCALRQKKYEQALQAFSFCIGQNPCAECFLLRGQTQAALGDAERALKDLNIAIEKSPQIAVAFQLRGNVHRELGHAEEAAKDFNDARSLSE